MDDHEAGTGLLSRADGFAPATAREPAPAAAHVVPWRQALQRADVVLAAVVALAWLLLAAPGPEYFMRNSETGHQLGGAWNLLAYGQEPHVDYVTSYGPARYWVSALGLMLSGGGLFGELLTRSVGAFFALILLLRVLRRLETPRVWAWPIFAGALLAMPPSHKYWTALCPLLVLWLLLRACERPRPLAWLAVGAAIGAAGLFRPDYGLFALAGVLAALLPRGLPGGRARAAAACVAGLALVLGPWLFEVGRAQDLVALFRDWFGVGAAVGAGLGMPHPLLHWTARALSGAFLIFTLVPIVGLWLVAFRPHPDAARQRFALATHVFALVNLVQSSHRADWPHLLQGIPPGFVALALVLAWPRLPALPRLVPAGLFGALGVFFAVGHVVRPNDPVTAWQHWAATTLGREAFEQRYLDATQMGHVARAARACVAPGQPTTFYPFTPQLHYYAQRPFAARLPFLAPGFFATPAQQQRTIAALEEQRPLVLFWDELYAYDGRPERSSVATHALLHAWVEQHYERQGQAEWFTVFALRGTTLAEACTRQLTYGAFGRAL